MKPLLKREWAVRIHEKLTGIYGVRSVSNKFSKIVDEVDQGTSILIQSIQEELGAFYDRPDAVHWMLDNLPAERVPNPREMRDLCRAAPRNVAALENKHVPASPEKVAEANDRIAEILTPARYHLAWAKNPKSQLALDAVVSAAKSDVRLREILVELVASGKCSDYYKLRTA